MAEQGDEVFIAGKGHETSQFYYDKMIPFDDREVIKNLLKRGREFLDTAAEG